MLPLFLMSPAQREREKLAFEAEAKRAKEWNENRFNFTHRHLHVIDGTTYAADRIFDVPTLRDGDIGHKLINPDRSVHSPSGRYVYANRLLSRGKLLELFCVKRRGTVGFSTDVVIPVLFERKQFSSTGYEVWMSITPVEVVTLRIGVRKAKGDVVIGGLGLGWLLSRVCRRKQVKRVCVVEKSQELLDMIRPAVEQTYPEVAAKDVTWVCGDAFDHVNHYGPDTCNLWDIWPGYGDAFDDREYQRLKKTTRRLWGWGDAVTGDH